MNLSFVVLSLRVSTGRIGQGCRTHQRNGVLLGEQADSKPARQGSNPCTVASGRHFGRFFGFRALEPDGQAAGCNPAQVSSILTSVSDRSCERARIQNRSGPRRRGLKLACSSILDLAFFLAPLGTAGFQPTELRPRFTARFRLAGRIQIGFQSWNNNRSAAKAFNNGNDVASSRSSADRIC